MLAPSRSRKSSFLCRLLKESAEQSEQLFLTRVAELTGLPRYEFKDRQVETMLESETRRLFHLKEKILELSDLEPRSSPHPFSGFGKTSKAFSQSSSKKSTKRSSTCLDFLQNEASRKPRSSSPGSNRSFDSETDDLSFNPRFVISKSKNELDESLKTRSESSSSSSKDRWMITGDTSKVYSLSTRINDETKQIAFVSRNKILLNPLMYGSKILLEDSEEDQLRFEPTTISQIDLSSSASSVKGKASRHCTLAIANDSNEFLFTLRNETPFFESRPKRLPHPLDSIVQISFDESSPKRFTFRTSQGNYGAFIQLSPEKFHQRVALHKGSTFFVDENQGFSFSRFSAGGDFASRISTLRKKGLRFFCSNLDLSKVAEIERKMNISISEFQKQKFGLSTSPFFVLERVEFDRRLRAHRVLEKIVVFEWKEPSSLFHSPTNRVLLNQAPLFSNEIESLYGHTGFHLPFEVSVSVGEDFYLSFGNSQSSVFNPQDPNHQIDFSDSPKEAKSLGLWHQLASFDKFSGTSLPGKELSLPFGSTLMLEEGVFEVGEVEALRVARLRR